MKVKFTFLVVLFLLTTSSYAIDQAPDNRRKLANSFLLNRNEMHRKNSNHNPLHQKTELHKPVNTLKSAHAIKQRLDGYTSMILDEGSGQWHEEKAEYGYDTNWNLILERGYEWDEMTNQLILDWKAEYTYDANGNLTQEIFYQLDEITNQLIAEDKYTYTYDANGNRTQYINYSLDDVSGQLIAWYKLDFTYDASKNLTKEIYYYFNQFTNQLELHNKNEYTYNNNSQQILSLYSNWSSQSNQWEEASSKTETTYDSKGNIALILQSDWDGYSQWFEFQKEEFTYDAKGNLTLDAGFSFTNNQWAPWYKEVFTFDDLGNNTQYINYNDWDSSTGEWKSIWKDEYIFNNNYPSSDLIWLFEDLGNFAHMMTDIREYEWNNDTKQWIYNYQITLNYSEVNVTSASILNTELSKIYPNPCSESVSFSFPDSYSQITFELFDLQGRKLISKLVGNDHKINMKELKSGMYLYKLHVDGVVKSGKLVKE